MSAYSNPNKANGPEVALSFGTPQEAVISARTVLTERTKLDGGKERIEPDQLVYTLPDAHRDNQPPSELIASQSHKLVMYSKSTVDKKWGTHFSMWHDTEADTWVFTRSFTPETDNQVSNRRFYRTSEKVTVDGVTGKVLPEVVRHGYEKDTQQTIEEQGAPLTPQEMQALCADVATSIYEAEMRIPHKTQMILVKLSNLLTPLIWALSGNSGTSSSL